MLDPSEAIRIATSLGSMGASLAKDQLSSVIAGNVFWVDSNGTGAGVSASHPGNFDQPFSTLTYAISRCTASKGDLVFVKPGHAETTTALAWSKAGVKVVGLGYGNNRPTFTATTAATDLINITGANCHLENVRLVGAASGCTALLDIGASDFKARKVSFEHGAAPLCAVTVVSMSHRFVLEDCDWLGTAAGPDFSVKVEGPTTPSDTTNDWHIIRPRASYGVSAGLDNAFLQVNISCTGYSVEDAIIIGFDTLAIDINSSTLAVGDGILTGYAAASAAITWANALDVGGALPMEFYVNDDPATRGKLWPTATPT